MWFEKFYWFISSENYLVISARDQAQNELIIKKYLGKNDIAFHTQIQGSAFTVVKNPNEEEIGQSTINQAALATLCHSKSWSLKVINDVYWVYAHQVSKTAPSGLSMPSGSFMIYGKKNFIRPKRLEMGFGFLFKVDSDSAKNHADERKSRLAREAEEARLIEEGKELPKQNLDTVAEDEEGEEDMDDSMSIFSRSETGEVNNIIVGKDTEMTTLTFNTGPKIRQSTFKKKKKGKEVNAGGKGANKSNQPKGGANYKQVQLDNMNKKETSQTVKNKRKKKLQKQKDKYGGFDEEERQVLMKLQGAKEIKRDEDAHLEGMSKKDKRKAKLKEKRQMRKKLLELKKNEEEEGKAAIDTQNKTKAAESIKEDMTEDEGPQVHAKDSEKGDEGTDNMDEDDGDDVDSTEAVFEEDEDDRDKKSENLKAKRLDKHETLTIAPSVIDNEQEQLLNDVLSFKDLTGKPLPSGKLLPPKQ